MNTRIGIDLGGTKIELVALDDDGRECLRRRVPTPQGDYAGTVRTVAALVHDAERRLAALGLGIASVGIGTPGSVSPLTGRLRNSNSVCLNDQPLGGLSRLDRLYDRVPARWHAQIFSDQINTRLLPAKHGDSSGVRGAAWLWGDGSSRSR